MPISGHGWEVLVTRLGTQQSGGKKRTYARYEVFIDGQAQANLFGHVCECPGPGDNRHRGNKKRIEQGRYPLWTQFGRYRSIGYSENLQIPADPPMPGLRLEATGNRRGILIHPGHPPKLYLSSIGCFNPTDPLLSNQNMNFWDSRERVIALINSLRNFAPAAFEHQTMTRITNAAVVVDGEPTDPVPDNLGPVLAAAGLHTAAPQTEPASLPISKSGAVACAQWLVDNFGVPLRAAVQGKSYRVKHLCGIVCQETAYKWLKWRNDHNAKEIVERCVFDASGDYPGTSRSTFPKNTAAFRAKYDDGFTNMLIEEANVTRRLQGYGDKEWVYKEYGIFQYDLQHVKTDKQFFRQKKWYDFNECLSRCCDELDDKLQSTGGDLWQAIKAYNGRGSRAEQYMQNVRIFTEYCAEVTGD